MSDARRGRLSYNEYLKLSELLNLQALQSEQHDELQFIIVHQTYELWFKLLLHEVRAIISLLDTKKLLSALRMLRRVLEIVRLINQQFHIMETMAPQDFHHFRKFLAPGSGMQSEQFRRLEIVSGLRSDAFSSLVEKYFPQLTSEMSRRSLNEAFLDALGSVDENKQAALVRIYTQPDAYQDLFLLAESLIEYDELIQHWRYKHVLMAERMIGANVIGTGGTPGVSYLESTLRHRFFPDLWHVRVELSRQAEEY